MHARVITLAVAAALLLPATAAADVKHVVKPGESLTSIAETDGLSVAALAAANHLSPTAQLTIGQVLEIPPQTATTVESTTTMTTTTTSTTSSTQQYTAGDTTTTGTTTTGAGATDTATTGQAVPPAGAAPEPTAQRVTASEIADVADKYGVPPALAEAIAWQESGWNNDEVSKDGAVGVMQIVPSAWTWIDKHLTARNPLEPDSAIDNVRAGVLLLHELLSLTGDNYRATAAAYYQGLDSVENHGMYRSTRRYVTDVLSLERKLGG